MAKKVESEVKETRKSAKVERKAMKNKEKQAILAEKKKIEDKIDALVEKKKTTISKIEKKDIKKQINDLKVQRKNIGKRDTFLRDVKAEMRLVRWPSKKEVFKYSCACLLFVAFFALFFYGIDVLFALVKDLID